jgi:hypothetical protein
MKYRFLALSGLAVSLVFAPAAQADSFSYNLQSSDSTVMLLSLTFTTAGSCSGAGQVCDITGITGTLTDTNFLSAPEAITSFAPDGTPPGPYLTSDFLFIYDNLINPDGTDPNFAGSVLDGTGGVVFYTGGSVPLEVGLSGGGENTYFLNESPDGVNYNYSGLGEELVGESAPVIPEPSPLLLVATGLLMLALAGRKLAPGLRAVKVAS